MATNLPAHWVAQWTVKLGKNRIAIREKVFFDKEKALKYVKSKDGIIYNSHTGRIYSWKKQ